MNEILAKYSKLKPEEILQLVVQIFEASRRQNHEAVRALSSRFPKEVAEKIRVEIRERMLPKPQEVGVAQLVEILKNKKVLFYTGAGI